MKKVLRHFNLKFLIFWILISPLASFSCDKKTFSSDGVDLIFDFESSEVKVMGVSGKKNETNEISKCDKFIGKYIKVAMGVEAPGLSSTSSGVFYDSFPNFFTYGIKDAISSFHFDTKEDLLSNYQKNQKKLDTCVDIIIKDEGNEILEFEDSKNCQANLLEKNSWVVYSGQCNFKINKNSNFKIQPQGNKSCLDLEFLKKEGFEPGDLRGRLKLEIGEISSDKIFKKLKNIGNIPLNLKIKSGADFYRDQIVRGDVHQDPHLWVIPEIQFMEIKINKGGENVNRIDFTFLVDNDSCKKVCIKGLCTSPCNFLSPLTGEITLSELNPNGLKFEISNIFVGDVLNPKWRGVLNNLTPIFLEGNNLIGKKYKLEFQINDPYWGYLLYKKELKRQLSLNRGFFNLSSRTGITSINEINSDLNIHDINEGKDMDMDMAIASSYGDILTIEDTTLGFSRLAENKDWPPVYSLACNKDYSICKKPDPSNLGKLSVVFEIIGEKDSAYEIKIIEMERKSKIISQFKVEGGTFPKIISENNEI